MKQRLFIILLSSLLIASFSFNIISYEAITRAEQQSEFDNNYYPKLLNKLHERLAEVEN